MLALAGCGDAPAASGTGAEASSTGSSTGAASSTAPSTSTLSADDTRGTTSPDETGVVFMLEPDVAPPRYECDIYEQDCPRGEKCMIWSRSGGSYGEASRCFPVAEDPSASGEPCHVEGDWYSGVDDCGAETMCWEVDRETLEGVCRPFCVGSASNPYCEDPSHVCPVYASQYSPCVPICNPLALDCGTGQVCIPHGDAWICGVDASGDMGAYGDACEFINVCDPGLVCVDARVVPPGRACEGSSGCCTEVCDTTDRAGDLQCAGAAGGQQCLRWYLEGTAPAGLENVGACAVPA